ncbi:hypothetical protein EJ110_NYTH07415 [Nymphaea thermarum]|nr:hypothetical protein EJ110_NYTH07415 [Nymphaea thermarum]
MCASATAMTSFEVTLVGLAIALIPIVSLRLTEEDNSRTLLLWLVMQHGKPRWDGQADAMKSRFGPSAFLDYNVELSTIKQRGSIDDYQEHFEKDIRIEVMPAVVNVMKPDSSLITLVKPQFEAHRSQVGSGGIVRDPAVHQEVLEKIVKGVEAFGFSSQGWIESPIKGAEGNTEFLVYFCRRAQQEP